MNRYLLILLLALGISCRQSGDPVPDAQQIVDRAIEAAGGDRYRNSRIRFVFRDREYIASRQESGRVLTRITETDSGQVVDTRIGTRFTRTVGGNLLELADTTSEKLSNAVNSVHYFAYLPYGLNDPAVRKAYLGRTRIKGSEYYKVLVTFEQEGGGKDYEDVFVYWFHTGTYLPQYFAYEYHTDGGGKRFREAYNERRIGGIRFVDYRNFSYDGPLPVSSLDSLFLRDELQDLSRIILTDIQVTPGNYN